MLVVTVSVEVPDPPGVRATIVGLRLSVGPVGELEAARVTVPAKLLRLLRVMVDDAWALARTLILVGLAEIEKSGLVCALRKAVIGVALASLLVIVDRLQFVSIVFVNE